MGPGYRLILVKGPFKGCWSGEEESGCEKYNGQMAAGHLPGHRHASLVEFLHCVEDRFQELLADDSHLGAHAGG